MTELFGYRKRIELFIMKKAPVAFRLIYKVLPAW